MKRISCAYEAKDGTIFKTRKAAFEREAEVVRKEVAEKWFHGFRDKLDKAVRRMDELMQDLLYVKTLMSEAGISMPESRDGEDEDIPY